MTWVSPLVSSFIGSTWPSDFQYEDMVFSAPFSVDSSRTRLARIAIRQEVRSPTASSFVFESFQNHVCATASLQVIFLPPPCSGFTAMSAPCFIPSNPDISGIGVRVAIYLQNLLGFGPAIWAIADGDVSDYELESAETQSTTNLVLAFAILISCIVQALTLGLTNYHASIVLSLSWMNNTNAFIYFLLYVQYKGQEGAGHVEPRWSAWMSHIKSQARSVLYISSAIKTKPPVNIESRIESRSITSNEHKDNRGSKRGVKILFKRIALLLGSLHLTVMAALGIWLWSAPQSFGTSDSSCAVEYGQLAILGARVSYGSNSLRLVSLAVYSLFILPGFNLLLPMVAFLGLYFWQHSRRQKTASKGALPARARTQDTSKLKTPRKAYAWWMPPDSLPVFVGLGFLLAVNVIFIADIELTLHRNEGLQDKQEDQKEDQWGFGQILAILLVLMPLRDLLETILARKLRQQELRIREHELNTAWKGAISRNDLNQIIQLFEGGADPNIASEDGRTAVEVAVTADDWQFAFTLFNNAPSKADIDMPFHDGRTPLEVAARGLRWDEVRRLITAKANINTVFHGEEMNIKTVLHAACYARDNQLIHFLLENGADPNIISVSNPKGDGFVFHCVLQYACTSHSDWELFRKTLEYGADPNLEGGRYGTALKVACISRYEDRAADLLKIGADPNLGDTDTHWVSRRRMSHQGFRGNNSALQEACLRGLLQTVKLLLEKGADIHHQGNKYGSALQAACLCRDSVASDIVKILLESGADPNAAAITSKDYGPAIVAASWHKSKSEELTRLLLRHHANPNVVGIDKEDNYSSMAASRTPLHFAIYYGHLGTAQLLLDGGADPNMSDSEGYTALELVERAQVNLSRTGIIDLLHQYGAVRVNPEY